jgi:hypothetical protein
MGFELQNAGEVKLICHSNICVSYAKNYLVNEKNKFNNTEKCIFLTSFEITVPIQTEFQILNLCHTFSCSNKEHCVYGYKYSMIIKAFTL